MEKKEDFLKRSAKPKKKKKEKNLYINEGRNKNGFWGVAKRIVCVSVLFEYIYILYILQKLKKTIKNIKQRVETLPLREKRELSLKERKKETRERALAEKCVVCFLFFLQLFFSPFIQKFAERRNY